MGVEGLDLSPPKTTAKHADDSLVIFQLRIREALRRDIKSEAAALGIPATELLEVLWKAYKKIGAVLAKDVFVSNSPMSLIG